MRRLIRLYDYTLIASSPIEPVLMRDAIIT